MVRSPFQWPSRGRARRGRGIRRRWVWLALLGLAAVLIWAVRCQGVRGFVEEELASQRLARIAPLVRGAAEEFGLDPYLVGAMVWVESSVRQRAESSAGALGLMQVQLPTAADQARRLGLPPPNRERLLSDPALNLRLGAGYFAWLLPRYGGDVEQALMAYNTGPGRFERWVRDAGGYAAWRARVDAEKPATPGTVRHYAAKVLRMRDDLAVRGALDAPAQQTAPRAP